MQLTSHRGDSGMKNSPGISIVHGSTPEKENISEFNKLWKTYAMGYFPFNSIFSFSFQKMNKSTYLRSKLWNK